MGELIKLLEFVERQGLFAGTLVIIILIGAWFFHKWVMLKFDKKFDKIFDENKKLQTELQSAKNELKVVIEQEHKKEEEKSHTKMQYIKNNPFFSGMDYYIQAKIPGLLFENEFKREVFTDILKFSLQSVLKNTKEYVDNVYHQDVDDTTFQNQIIHVSKQSYSDFLQQCKLEGVPPVVIRKFNNWAAPLTRFLFSSIENICSSPHYETTMDKLIAILFIKHSLYGELIDNLELFLDEVNGDFDGLIYKGITCQSDHE